MDANELIKHINLIDIDNNNLLIKRDNSNDLIFTLDNKPINTGGYNKVYDCVDTVTNKTYILREFLEKEPFQSFCDNIKHIVLYVYIRKKIGNVKFIAQPYYFGYNMKNKNFYIIMEKAKYSLMDYLGFMKPDKKAITFLMYDIFYYLKKLNNNSIHFIHCDFKSNNIMLDSMNNPLIIDFGLARFNIINDDGTVVLYDTCDFKQAGRLNNDKPILNTIYDMLYLFDSIKYLDFTFNFIKNKNTHIFDHDNMNKLFDICKKTNKNIYSLDLEEYFKFSELNISLKELGENIGVLPPDEIQFNKKYLKYKKKYLSLLKKMTY